MGCCFGKDEDKTSQSGDVNERTRLLGNPVSNNQARGSTSHDEYGNQSANSAQKGDEQSALTRILHQTATNVIDVSTLDAHNVEHHEYMDRAKQYSHRVASTNGKIYQSNQTSWFLTDVPAVERVLAADLLPVADIEFINSVANKVAEALQEVKVKHKEDLVVQFGIP